VVRVLASHARSHWFKSSTAHHENPEYPAKSSQKFTKDLLDNFLSSRASGTSPKTIALYHFALDKFIGYPITPEGIRYYLESLACGNGKHNYYRCIKTLCRWLYRTNQLLTNPTETVLPPRRQKKILPAISQEQLDTLVKFTPTNRDKVILNLLWYSGMKRSEVANVQTNNFNWEEGTVIVLGKGNRYRKALAGNSIVENWFTEHDSQGITSYGIQTMLRKLAKTTGIKCNAHSFRRGFCAHNVKPGLFNKVIQSLGGWETPDMVSHYAASLIFDDALELYHKVSKNSVN